MMTGKERLKEFLFLKGEATNAEIAEYMRYHPDALSWRTRVSDIRKELQLNGGDIICVHIKKGIYLYKVIFPDTNTTPSPVKVEPTGQMAMVL